jgi:ribosome biogenesis GTPase
VDRLWIVQALDTPPNLRSLERYLAVAWESGTSPELVLTKSDLAADLAAAVALVEKIAFDVPVRAVSTEDANALEALEESLIPGQTIALVGPSGAGKSTLVNRLAHAELVATGEVRAGDRKGRHTTTGRQLIPLPCGAVLLDTPGLRELKVLDLSDGLELTFPDIEALASECRFRDCSHTSEPGCAVLGAVRDQVLPPDRLASYTKLQAEAEFQRRKADPRAQASHLADWKTSLKTLKYHPKHRDRD